MIHVGLELSAFRLAHLEVIEFFLQRMDAGGGEFVRDFVIFVD